MADDKPWQTFTFETHYPEDDGGTRADMVVAPDRDTARRLAAVQTLSDLESTLLDQGADSFLDFYDGAGWMDVMSEWGDLNGCACPNCTSHVGRPTGDHADLDGATRDVHECDSCGYRWLPLGFGARRDEIIERSKLEIAKLDRTERLSLAGDPTLDTAVEDFREMLDRETAQVLRDTAEQYNDDGMIEDGTWEGYRDETEPYLKEEPASE